MICTYYWAIVRDREGNELARAKCWSFDEGYWNLNKFREMYENAWSFSVEYTDTKIM